MHRVLFYIILLCIANQSYDVFAQKVVYKSEDTRPKWLNNPPKPGNPTFRYYIASAENKNLKEARMECLLELAENVKNELNLTGATIVRGSLEQNDGGNESFYLEYELNLDKGKVRIIYKKITDYYEQIAYSVNNQMYRLHTLYAVATDQAGSAQFDEVTFTGHYGMNGLMRSVIPGVGQLHKGHKVKALTIIGGEVLLLGGAFTFESMRADYSKKIRQTQNAEHIRTYSNKADNYSTFRNICIGGAAVLYIYNLVDAFVSPGAKRTLINKEHFSVRPVSTKEYHGINIAYRF